jgi:RimJ/RimL family protein N-acetyltransferase
VPLVARDGRQVRVRHLQREDAPRLERLFYQLSSESRYRRFFAPVDHVDPARVREEARRLATIDPRREAALVAVIAEADQEEIVAVARFTRLLSSVHAAEASIVVRDDLQSQGVGIQLFDLLIQVALARGIEHLVLLTHADNLGMINLVKRLGLPFKGHFSSGLYEMDVQLTDGLSSFFPFSSGVA